MPRRERRERVESALAHVGLETVAGRLASTHSGGMVRRLELAQALVTRPRLLVTPTPRPALVAGRPSRPGCAPSARSWWCWSWPRSSGCASSGGRWVSPGRSRP